MELIWRTPEGPTRITIQDETHEALFGTQPPWEFVVPDDAEFEVHFGMLGSSWRKASTDGVRFTATIDAESAQGKVLVAQTVEPMRQPDHRSWLSRRADLSSYAGERVRINLTVDNLGTSDNDFAYWGDPVVFTRSQRGDIIPVILISCDTLRADHVSCYGYSRETTPHLDEFAKESALFENAIAAEPWTLTAHVSMLTGLYPKNHGVTSDVNLAEAVTTLAEVLSETGYLTAGFTGHGIWLLPQRGFSHGFDTYSAPWPFRNVFDTRELVNKWLDSHRTLGVFMLFHNYDIHSASSEIADLPYFPVSEERLYFAKAFDPPPSLEREGKQRYTATAFLMALNRGELALPMEEERDYIIALYDDTIRAVDLALHGFFERLKELGLYDRALIIVTSDHGESFGEHGLYLHREVYESCCRVPLIVKSPHGKFAGRRVTDLVQLVDLFPTVLDVLGLAGTTEVDGRSLVGLLNRWAEPRRCAYIRRFEYRAVRTLKWKLVRDNLEGDYELYRLVDDPEEQHNLSADAPPALAVLSEELDRFHQLEMEGWHLAFENPDTSRGIVEMQFVCRTGDEFEACAIVFGETVGESGETYSRSVDGHSVVGAVRLRFPDRDELIVKTSSPEGKILLTVASKDEFTVRMCKDSSRPGRRWETVLDTSAAGSYPKPDSVEGKPAGEPTLSVWYEVPAIKGPRARELTKEELEHLRAIGYVR